MGVYKNLWDDCKTTIHFLPNEIMEMIFKSYKMQLLLLRFCQAQFHVKQLFNLIFAICHFVATSVMGRVY